MDMNQVMDRSQELTRKSISLLEECTQKIKMLTQIKDTQAQIIKLQSETIASLEEKCELLQKLLEKRGVNLSVPRKES